MGRDSWWQANTPWGLSTKYGPTRCLKTHAKERSNDDKWNKISKIYRGEHIEGGMKVVVQNTMLESHMLLECHPRARKQIYMFGMSFNRKFKGKNEMNDRDFMGKLRILTPF